MSERSKLKRELRPLAIPRIADFILTVKSDGSLWQRLTNIRNVWRLFCKNCAVLLRRRYAPRVACLCDRSDWPRPVRGYLNSSSNAPVAKQLGQLWSLIADVRFWPKAAIAYCTAHVRFWG